MNFLKNLSFRSGGIGGNLPYDVVKDGDADTYSVNEFDIVPGKSKNDATRVSIFRSTAEGSNALTTNALKRMKTLRHPNILAFRDGLELPSGQVLIITEQIIPLEYYLENIRQENGTNSKEEAQAIAWGMKSILSALEFINVDCKMAHGRICPSSIFVTMGGDWKLGGFALLSEVTSSGPSSHFIANDFCLEAKYKSPERLAHHWKTIGSGPTWALDIYSLGCTFYSFFNRSFTTNTDALSKANVPKEFHSGYKRMLDELPNSRIRPAKLRTHAYFKSTLIKALEFVENLAVKNPEEKSEFYKDLVQQVDAFPKTCCIYKILPALLTVVEIGGGSSGPVKLDPSASNILPVMMKIGGQMEASEFKSNVLPTIVRLFSCSDRAVRFQLLQMMDSFAQHLDAKVINSTIFENICTGFTDTAPVLRELTVKSMLHIAEKLSDNNLNVKLMRWFSKMQGDPEPAIRTNTTICLGRIAPQLNAKTRAKVLLPAFSRATKDPFPHARLAALRSLVACEEFFSAAEIACQICPLVSPMLMDNTYMVRSEAFEAVKKYIKSLDSISEQMKIDEEKAAQEAALNQEAELKQQAAAAAVAPAVEQKRPVETSTSAWNASPAATPNAIDFDESPTGDGGWGDDDDLLGLTSPVKAPAKKKSSTEDEFFDAWSEEQPSKPKEASILPSSGSKSSAEQRRQEAKKRREQRKQANTGGLKLKAKAKKTDDDWDDFDF